MSVPTRDPLDSCPSFADPARLPDAQWLNAAVRAGAACVTLSEHAVPSLGSHEPRVSAEVIRFLRDAFGCGMTVHWQGPIESGIDDRELAHILASVDDAGNRTGRVLGFRQGPPTFYWRRGPGFIRIRDRRRGSEYRDVSIGDPRLLAIFERLQRPLDARAEPLDAGERRAAEFLVAQRMALRIGDVLVTLPSRMARWPEPAFGW